MIFSILHSSPLEPFPRCTSRRRVVYEQASGEGCSTQATHNSNRSLGRFLFFHREEIRSGTDENPIPFWQDANEPIMQVVSPKESFQ